MWPLKHPKVYRESRGSRIFVVVFCALLLSGAGWFLFKDLAERSQYEAQQRVLTAVEEKYGIEVQHRSDDDATFLKVIVAFKLLLLLFGVAAAIVSVYGSLTIGPDEVVLRRPFLATVRIRQGDILGRRKRYADKGYSFDIIVSRQRPGVTIEVPGNLRRDTLFNMWLHALPDLDDPPVARDPVPNRRMGQVPDGLARDGASHAGERPVVVQPRPVQPLGSDPEER